MAKIDIDAAPEGRGSGYPAPYDAPCRDRSWKKLGDAAGLTKIGVNLVRVPAGAWSSQRHWHALEDEFVYILEGEAALVLDAGETRIGPGDCAGFPAGVRDGHMMRNDGPGDLVFLVVSNRDDADWGEYSDIDMAFGPKRYSGPNAKTRKDGTPIG
ncbi:MAG: cupin domain-containing protein [Alphaproteobacteria bacterium]|nr:cupin domain-containing protein [Alphaproteobacteria bacterium]